jgi:acylglycerol lipase
MEEAPEEGWAEHGKGKGRDLMMVHGGSEGSTLLIAGLSDYGLRYAPHITHFLKAGFRVIVPDLPSVSERTCNEADDSMDVLPGTKQFA